MKALFIGGTGTISTDVVALAQQKGWEITLLNRGSKKMPEGIHSIIADINDEEAVAKAIVSEHYDVVAQFIGYTAEDVKRDIRLFQNKTRRKNDYILATLLHRHSRSIFFTVLSFFSPRFIIFHLICTRARV